MSSKPEVLIMCQNCKKIKPQEEIKDVYVEDKPMGLNTGNMKEKKMCKECIEKINNRPVTAKSNW